MHLHEGPDQGHTSDRIEKKKSPEPGGIRTQDLSVRRRVLYCCAATAATKNEKHRLELVRFKLVEELSLVLRNVIHEGH